MSLIDSLRPECLQIGSKARDKTAVLHEITKLALKSGLLDRKSTRLNSSHIPLSRMPSSA